MDFDFESSMNNMSLNEQIEIWKQEYAKLYNTLEKERNEWKIRE